MKTLKVELNKHFYEDEILEILSFYEELIEDRLSNHEDINDILNDYQIKKITKDLIPNMLVKRENDTLSKITKSLKQVLLILLSTPLLIPLGILIIVITSISVALIISLVAVIFSLIVFLLGLAYQIILTPISVSSVLLLIGLGLTILSLIVLSTIWIYQLVVNISKRIIYLVSKYLLNKGVKES